MLGRLRIVLHRPTGPANVGAVCRAMKNMGLRDLVLVAPKYPTTHEQSVAYATHGVDILEQARIVETLEEALVDCVRTYATSAKHGLYRRQTAVPPETAGDEATPFLDQGPVAVAFGPEATGFDVKDLLLFDRIITIPADDEFPVLNLAAAAMVVCYEFRRAWLRRTESEALPMAINHGLAPDQRKQILFCKLFDALDRIDYFSDQSPEKLRFGLRHLFGRLDMTVHEADILIGMAQQIRWYADHHRQRTDPPSEK